MNSDSGKLSSTSVEYAGVIRRIGAMFYDSLLLIAVLAVATVPFFVMAGTKTLVPSIVGWPVYILYLLWQLSVIILFFSYFWTSRGQTLGMQVWSLRVEDKQGNLMSWPLAIKRLLFAAIPWIPGIACLGIAEQTRSVVLKWLGEGALLLVVANLVVVKFSSSRQTWHERLSGTRLIVQRNLRVLPKDSAG